MDWYARYPRKFDMGTLGWSLAERGAYSALLDAYYENEGPLPADDHAIAATIRTDVETWRVISGKVLGKFEVRDGMIHHPVCDRELAEQQRRADVSRKNGSKGGRPKSIEKEQDKPSGLAKPNLNLTQKKPQYSTIHNKDSSLRSESIGSASPKGSRLPAGWAPSEAALQWARQAGLIDLHPRETENFTDYWKAKAGAGARKADWDATWRVWLRKAGEDRGRRGGRVLSRSGMAGVASDAALQKTKAEVEDRNRALFDQMGGTDD